MNSDVNEYGTILDSKLILKIIVVDLVLLLELLKMVYFLFYK